MKNKFFVSLFVALLLSPTYVFANPDNDNSKLKASLQADVDKLHKRLDVPEVSLGIGMFITVGGDEQLGYWLGAMNIIKNSPAEKAGIREMDVIVEVNGAPITSLVKFSAEINGDKIAGQEMELRIYSSHSGWKNIKMRTATFGIPADKQSAKVALHEEIAREGAELIERSLQLNIWELAKLLNHEWRIWTNQKYIKIFELFEKLPK